MNPKQAKIVISCIARLIGARLHEQREKAEEDLFNALIDNSPHEYCEVNPTHKRSPLDMGHGTEVVIKEEDLSEVARRRDADFDAHRGSTY